MAEVVVAVGDERCEWVHSMGRLHDRNFVGLQREGRRGELRAVLLKGGLQQPQDSHCPSLLKQTHPAREAPN